MKALFITTETVDCQNHVRAWESAFSYAVHHKFDIKGLRNDWQAVEIARNENPQVIFYIGAVQGRGIPRPDTFHQLRNIAPVVHLCSDAMDKPWHSPLLVYKGRGCFDLQVSLDGARYAPVDLATLTPVDHTMFHPEMEKDVRCGFSGTVGRWNTRAEIVRALEWFGGLTVRERAVSYADHAIFMSRCQMILNTSWTGTGQTHHIKGRVLEAGFAECALLEHEDSPIGDWFPKGCWIPWRNAKDIAEIISDAKEEVSMAAGKLAFEVKNKYSAKLIYQEILNHVDFTQQRQAAEYYALS